jgi:hypothetical protein
MKRLAGPSDLDFLRWLEERGGRGRRATYDQLLGSSVVQRCSVEVARWLVQERGADPLALNGMILVEACNAGLLGVARWLVMECGVDPRMPDNLPLIRVCYKGNLELARVLVAGGADPRARQDRPLTAACQMGHLPLVRWLVQEHGADPRARNDEPLVKACRFGYANHVARWLVQEHGADPRARGCLPLLKACCGCGSFELARWLIDRGARLADLTEELLEEHGDDIEMPFSCSWVIVVSWMVDTEPALLERLLRVFERRKQTGRCPQVLQWLRQRAAGV